MTSERRLIDVIPLSNRETDRDAQRRNRYLVRASYFPCPVSGVGYSSSSLHLRTPVWPATNDQGPYRQQTEMDRTGSAARRRRSETSVVALEQRRCSCREVRSRGEVGCSSDGVIHLISLPSGQNFQPTSHSFFHHPSGQWANNVELSCRGGHTQTDSTQCEYPL